jgi:uncharacterized protein (TIGR02757 family)
MTKSNKSLKAFLDEKVEKYNRPEFIASDPISIPHRFSNKQDREIAGLFAATLAWGQRVTILRNAERLMQWMDFAPFDFIINHQSADLKPFCSFVHRTFNGDDCLFFIAALHEIYSTRDDLESVFVEGLERSGHMEGAISHFRRVMLSTDHLPRSRKHLPDPMQGSASKRINMYLRWMVRTDDRGVDFGHWKKISPSKLLCPLDVHSGRTARSLGLLSRLQDDNKAVNELTEALRKLNPRDPVSYDFALYGLGVFEKGATIPGNLKALF